MERTGEEAFFYRYGIVRYMVPHEEIYVSREENV